VVTIKGATESGVCIYCPKVSCTVDPATGQIWLQTLGHRVARSSANLSIMSNDLQWLLLRVRSLKVVAYTQSYP